MKLVEPLFLIITVFPFLSGCTVMPCATTDDITRLEREISDIREGNVAVNEMKNEGNNEDYLVLEKIRSNMREIERRIEDLEHRQGGGVEKEEENEVLSPQPEVPTLFMPDMKVDKNRGEKEKKAVTTNLEPNEMGINEFYQLAYNDLKLKEYDSAIKRFRDFLKYYKESDLADNAQYWIGESYYARKDYKRALLEFKKVIDEYPTGNKRPDALFKYGMSFYELNDHNSALRELRKLVELYPDNEIIDMVMEKIEMIVGNKN